MDRILLAGRFTVTAAALGLAACSGSSAPADPAVATGGSAQLSVSLMDAPVDDVVEVHVEITAIWLKPQGDGPAFELPLEESPFRTNLLELTDGNAALLVDGAAIEAGSYAWLAMDVNARIDGVSDSYVVTDTGTWEEIFVPSGRVRLVSGFEAEANAALALIFDWDLRKGLVHPPGLGGYILKPAFRVIDTAAFGRISGSIDVATVMLAENECNADDEADNFDVGNAIYVFAGHDIVPDDLDEEMDVTPIGTVDALLNEASTAYEYSTILPFGDYTVAFSCQAANDAAETNETGNEDPAEDTVSFFEPAVNVSLSSAPGETSVVVDF